jgi:uncharacterized protein (DUF305 family)
LPVEICSPDERAAMPGMLRPEELDAARRAEPAAFDALFVRLMSFHHAGAIEMSDEAIHQAGDVRLKLMAHGIRHGQRGEIQLMLGNQGLSAVRSGVHALFARFGEHPSDRAELPPGR